LKTCLQYSPAKPILRLRLLLLDKPTSRDIAAEPSQAPLSVPGRCYVGVSSIRRRRRVLATRVGSSRVVGSMRRGMAWGRRIVGECSSMRLRRLRPIRLLSPLHRPAKLGQTVYRGTRIPIQFTGNNSASPAYRICWNSAPNIRRQPTRSTHLAANFSSVETVLEEERMGPSFLAHSNLLL
jgi:hypothetical protein